MELSGGFLNEWKQTELTIEEEESLSEFYQKFEQKYRKVGRLIKG